MLTKGSTILETIKPVLDPLHLQELKRDLTEMVIRWYMCLPLLKDKLSLKDYKSIAASIMRTKNIQQALAELPAAALSQAYIHVDEFLAHRRAGIKKLRDLRKTLYHGEKTALSTTLVITGSKDKITKEKDINIEFADVLNALTKRISMDTGHDDMFINASIQNEATEYIASFALSSLGIGIETKSNLQKRENVNRLLDLKSKKKKS